MQTPPQSDLENSLCPSGKVLEAKASKNFEHLLCISKRLEKNLEKIEAKIDNLSENSINDFNKIESISSVVGDFKEWRASVEKFQTLFAQHLSEHKVLEESHRRYSQGWGLFGGFSMASMMHFAFKGISLLTSGH